MKDPIVEEIRSFRDAHARRFNYDLDEICEDFKSHQKKCGHRLASLHPRKLSGKSIHNERNKPSSSLSDS